MKIEDAIMEVLRNHPKNELIDSQKLYKGTRMLLNSPLSIGTFHKALSKVKKSGKVVFLKSQNTPLN